MTDYFAVLDLPRRPLVDQADLKARYLREAARLHPDSSAGDTAQFRTLQEAYQTLSDSPARLRHLLDLEFPSVKTSPVPMQGDLFMAVGQAIQVAQDVIKRRSQTHSALALALLAADVIAVQDQVRRVLLDVEMRQAVLQGELADADTRWPHVEVSELHRLGSHLAFIHRWQAQLKEWDFQLAHP